MTDEARLSAFLHTQLRPEKVKNIAVADTGNGSWCKDNTGNNYLTIHSSLTEVPIQAHYQSPEITRK